MQLCLLALSLGLIAAARADDIALASFLNVRDADNEHARPSLDKSAKNQPLSIAGHAFAKGVGTQVDNRLAIDLAGATRFTASAGVDDATTAAEAEAIAFEVLADGQSLWRRELKKGDAAV